MQVTNKVKHYIKLLLAVLVLLFGGTLTGLAQIPCKFEHYSTEDGLSHDIITSMHKDHDGFMWFGTWSGLNRFDGHHFTAFHSVAGDSSHLKSDRIDQIKEDTSGHLWVKSNDGSIYQFDKRTERFRSLRSLTGLKEEVRFSKIQSAEDNQLWLATSKKGVIVLPNIAGTPDKYIWLHTKALQGARLPSDKINYFYRDASKATWLATTNGLIRILIGTNGKLSLQNIHLPAGCSKDVLSIASRHDSLFVATAKGQVVVMSIGKVKILSLIATTAHRFQSMITSKRSALLYLTNERGELIAIDPRTSHFNVYPSYQKDRLGALYEDRYGDIWIQPYRKGLIQFSKGSSTFRTFSQLNDSYNKNPVNHFKVFEDVQGRLWSVLRDGGFGYYDRNTSSFKYFYNEPGSKNRRLSNLVSKVFYDQSGVMWLHTDERGLEKVIFSPNTFVQQQLVDQAIFLSDNEVRGLLQDRKGNLWVGAKSGKLYIFKNGLPIKKPFVNEPKGSIGAIYRFYEDRAGNIWIATKENGLYCAQPTGSAADQYRLQHFSNGPDKTSISSDQIYSVVEDARGSIWVGSLDSCLSIGTRVNGKFIFERYSSGKNGYPKGFEKIRYMATDHQSRVWIATTDGLVIADRDRQGNIHFQAHTKRPGDVTSLGNNDIQHITKDNKGRMWLATSGGGLNLALPTANGRQIRFKAYTTKNGLANDYVLSCQQDKQGFIWVATKGSLSRFDPATGKFRNYNTFDGLPNLGFSEGASQLLDNGKLVFGSIHGLISFDPSTIADHPAKASIAFTDLQVNNTSTEINGKDGILKQGINWTDRIKLKYSDNSISIGFKVLDFRYDDRSRYSYRLKGFDDAWHSNNGQLKVSYNDLPPGNYLFEVRCSDPSLYQNVAQRTLGITITPPLWRTWWAYTIYLLIAIAIFELCRRTAVTMLRLRQKIAVERSLAALKLEFFTNVSHELRTPLTLIANPVDHVLNSEQLTDSGRQYLTIAKRNVTRMAGFVDQLLDLRKVQDGKTKLNRNQVELISFIRGIGDCFSGISLSRNVKFELSTELKECHAWIDPEKMETVLYNVLGNAFKFSPRDSMVRLKLSVDAKGKNISIVVEDEGYGVPTDELEKIFLLYHETSKPDSRSSIKGSGIGLALAKDLVELHGGKIYAMNREKKGLVIYIDLPLIINEPGDVSEGMTRTDRRDLTDLPVITLEGVQGANTQVEDHHKANILLVEDNDDMRDLLYGQLSGYYNVSTATNGAEGLALAKDRQPDMILSDVMMPKMDGIEMLGHLREHDETSHIPVVLLTAKSAVETQIQALEYGADLYLTKPFNTEVLVKSIKNLLNRREHRSEDLASGKKVVELSPGQIIVTSKDEQFLQKVIALVEEKMADPDLDLDVIAEVLNMTRPTFYRKFKSLTQKTPVDFVRDMRLLRAKQYLDNGMGNIKEIAYITGFASPKYFSTCFKNKFNISPSEHLRNKGTHEA